MSSPSVVKPRVELRAAAVQAARERARLGGQSVFHELQAATGQDAATLRDALGTLLGIAVVDAAALRATQPAFDILALNHCVAKGSAVVRTPTGELMGIVSDPFDNDLRDWLQSRGRTHMRFGLSLKEDIDRYLAGFTVSDQPARQNAAPLVKPANTTAPSAAAPKRSPAVQLVDSTLLDALHCTASDIHLESTRDGLAIKYRVDGVLVAVSETTGKELAEQVISRLKVLAELDIAERRVPQDGSFRIAHDGRDVDLRLSVMPSIHGEDAVIRILDKRSMIEAYGALTLEALGFDGDSLRALRQLAEQPYGMLLVTGPTGSGKTTTLYATLTEIHDGRDKIITIEDPVEYQLPGILQIPVNEKKGLTFARGLRSILRHDPDKIMVGEIRDTETAEIAVQSALTGHLVLTTVHANNVFDVLGRFTHMGIDPYAFVSALNGIWAQRLVRINCPGCAVEHAPSDADLEKVNLARGDVDHYRFRQGPGCAQCRHTGYKGRKAIAEILMLTDEIREMIVERRPIRQIKEAARNNGTRTLREAALALVANGLTTLDEIKRVTQHA